MEYLLPVMEDEFTSHGGSLVGRTLVSEPPEATVRIRLIVTIFFLTGKDAAKGTKEG